ISNRLTLDIPIFQILYIEVFNKKSLIHTPEGVFTTYTPLAKLSQDLPSEHFMRCHKSFLVNMEAIISTGKDAFLLKDGTSIPISTRESKRLRELYNDWFWAKARRS
ncbi:MAG: LytTR family DNA-binding domain-containing protein, partial [Eubacterium sp.]